MSQNTEPYRQRVIESWNQRARAYKALTDEWPIFTSLARRLIATLKLPEDSSQSIIDLASGSGLVSELLLRQAPAAVIHMADPAEHMLDLAQRIFGDRVASYHLKAGHELAELNLQVDAILCNVAFHLMDEKQVLQAASRSLRAGGCFITNLWGHSFAETADEDRSRDWRPVLSQLIKEFGQPAPTWPAPQRARCRSREGLRRAAEEAGLTLELCEVDEDIVSANFSIAFLAMYDDWPGRYAPEIRAGILGRAMDLFCQDEPCLTARLCFRKNARVEGARA
jgi:ubiquinone/menaquinone biosynthesis C-methylase UbiE